MSRDDHTGKEVVVKRSVVTVVPRESQGLRVFPRPGGSPPPRPRPRRRRPRRTVTTRLYRRALTPSLVSGPSRRRSAQVVGNPRRSLYDGRETVT